MSWVLVSQGDRISLWRRAPLRELLAVTPLWIIRAEFDLVCYWPIASITNLKATHSYYNGAYQGTYVSIYFEGKPVEFRLPSEEAYEALQRRLSEFRVAMKHAVAHGDAGYFMWEDDLLEYRNLKPQRLAESRYRADQRRRRFLQWASFTGIAAALILAARPVPRGAPGLLVPGQRTADSAPIDRGSAPKAYTRPAAAPNGQPWPTAAAYVNGYQRLNADGLSSITVDNSQNDSDVFVKAFYMSSGNPAPARIFFIPKGGRFGLQNLRQGQYDIRYLDLTTGGISRSEALTLQKSAPKKAFATATSG